MTDHEKIMALILAKLAKRNPRLGARTAEAGRPIDRLADVFRPGAQAETLDRLRDALQEGVGPEAMAAAHAEASRLCAEVRAEYYRHL